MTNTFPNTKVIGVLGGGQLGRMMAQAAHRLGIKLKILDPSGIESPAGQIANESIEGSFNDPEKLKELAKGCDILTVEIEHVNAQALEQLMMSKVVEVHPTPSVIRLIQDKYTQKLALQKANIPIADFMIVNNLDDAHKVGEIFGYPYMLKSRRWAYDGKGNSVVKDKNSISISFSQLGTSDLYAEKWVPFAKELAVMIVAQGHQEIKVYPVVETSQKDNICHTVLAPARISQSSQESVIDMAYQTMKVLSQHGEVYGIYGIEFFLCQDGSVLLNEIAPRPHNSGHYTIEACETDQFEQHLRAIAKFPIGSCDLKVGAALMLNVLGDKTSSESITYAPFTKAYAVPGASVHYYGKKQIRSGRKLGHITIIAPSMEHLVDRVEKIDSSLLSLKSHDMNLLNGSWRNTQPIVGIIMGSDSDLPTMKSAAEILDQFEVCYELTIVSAHRTPERMFQYAKEAKDRGIKVIIAGAGGAAHLPGMVAALTTLPVVGVPVKTSTLNGEDSLLSIVQMPRGVPVATVAIGNAMNAGLLALRILGVANESLSKKMEEFLKDQERQVNTKIDKLDKLGWKNYV